MNLIGVKITGDILTAAEINAVTQGLTAPAIPIVTRVGGVANAPVLATAAMIERTPTTVVYLVIYDITPAAAGVGVYSVAAPSGYTRGVTMCGCYVASTSTPAPTALTDARTFIANFGSAVAHKLVFEMDLIKL